METDVFFSNFVGMKQTLPELIRQNKDLRQILLEQEGGIVKYLAEHLDANGTAALFTEYQNHCVDIFFEKYKWDIRKVWSGDEMRRAALGEMEHLWKEVRYQRLLMSQLTKIPQEAVEVVEQFMELYLSYAYKQNRLRWHPNGISDRDIYREVLGMYSTIGLAYRCMELILREHHATGELVKSENDLWTEFQIRQWGDQLTLALFGRMRQAVADMLVGKTDEQCRQMAIDTMERLRGFSQMIYTDEMVEHLRSTAIQAKSQPLRNNYMMMAEQRERDGEWLRDIANRTVFEEISKKVTTHTMRFYFCEFVNILKEIGRIWAAQLKIRDIDMKDLEKDVCCILNPADGHHYYVDKYYTDDLPDSYCISRIEQEGIEEQCDDDETEEGVYDDSKEDTNIQDWDLFRDWILKDKVIEAIKAIPVENVIGDVKRHFVIHKVLWEIRWLRHSQSTRYVGLMKYWKVVNFKTKSFQDDGLKLFKKIPTAEWGSQMTPESDLGENYRKFAETVRNTFTRIIDGKLDDIRDFYVPGKIKYNQAVADNS